MLNWIETGKRLIRVGVLVLLLVSLVLSAVPVQAASPNWTISGNKVYIDDSNVYLSASPYTLGSSGWVEFEVQSKKYSGEVDVGWGFTSDEGGVTRLQVWREVDHTVYYWVAENQLLTMTLHNITAFEVLVPGSVEPNIGTTNNAKLARAWSDEFPNGVVIAYETQSGELTEKTVTYYDDVQVQKSYISTYPDWSNVNRPFSTT